jgi:type I restriction enzyme S subunit
MKWDTKPFSEVVDILDSRRVPVNSEERAKRPGDIPYYGATGQVGFIDTHIFDEELVLLGEDGAPFLDAGKPKAYLVRGKSWVNNHAHVLRGKPGLLNSFLLYQLNNLDYRPYVSGTTRLKLPQGPMKQIPLLVPLEDEQRRIVAEIEKQFTRLEAGVAALRRVQANLKRYRAAVLKAACEGQLVPTEAELQKSEGRGQKEFETGEQLLQRILAERRKNWEESNRKSKIQNRKYREPAAPDLSAVASAKGDTANLPPLPEGWTWAAPDQLSAFDEGAICAGPFGTIFKARDFRPAGVPIIFLRHVAPGRYLTHKPGFMDTAKWEELFRPYSVFGGELLVTKLGEPPGVCAIYPEGIGPAMVTPDVMKMTPNARVAMPRFLMHYFNSQIARDFATGVAFGTTRLRLTLPIFREMPVPLPPLAEQTRIVAEVERRLSVVEELESVVSANLQRAVRLRQSVLQKAFTGELV